MLDKNRFSNFQDVYQIFSNLIQYLWNNSVVMSDIDFLSDIWNPKTVQYTISKTHINQYVAAELTPNGNNLYCNVSPDVVSYTNPLFC